MERELFEAALLGNVGVLLELVREHPLILHGIALSSSETPLHIGAMAGHLDFAKELIRLKPEFAEELNQDGFIPLHIASANGYVSIVRELLHNNHAHCLLRSSDNKTALHYASTKGRIEVIDELLCSCVESIEAVTTQRQTALHLALKCNQVEAFKFMIGKLKMLGKEHVVNLKDEQANTVLHIATHMKRREAVELLLVKDVISNGVVDVNTVNVTGLTALDLLLLFPSEAGDREMEGILRNAGAMRAQDLHASQLPNNPTQPVPINSASGSSDSPSCRLVDYFRFRRGRDSPSDARTALLVIAVLIAAATFQAGLSPPGGAWQDTITVNQTKNGSARSPHTAGKSILSSTDVISFSLFVYFNSVGFYMSLYMLQILTYKFPLRLELQICMVAMMCTYNIAMVRMGPDQGDWTILYHVFSVIVPLAIPQLTTWLRILYEKRRQLPFSQNRINTESA